MDLVKEDREILLNENDEFDLSIEEKAALLKKAQIKTL